MTTEVVRDVESITPHEIDELRAWFGDAYTDWRGVAIIRTLMIQNRLMRDLLKAAPPVQQPTPIRVETRSQCDGVRPEFCGLQNDDAKQFRGTFAEPNATKCKGCGVRLDLTQ